MATQRLNKVAQAVKEEVARILQQELKDPRIGFVTITRVKVTADLSQATIYFTLLQGNEAGGRSGFASPSESHEAGGRSGAASSGRSQGSASETETGLKSATGFIRRLLGERLRLRVTPEVIFRLDTAVEETFRINKLLDELKKAESTDG